MKITADSPLAHRCMVFKDGQPLGFVQELDLDPLSLAYKQLQALPVGELETIPDANGPFHEDVADFVVLGDLDAARKFFSSIQ